MQIIKYPQREKWATLTERPTIAQDQIADQVKAIMNEVKTEGNSALFRLTKKYDQAELSDFRIPLSKIQEAKKAISPELQLAIQTAYKNISSFHKTQRLNEEIIETMQGVKCWRKSIAIEKVGLYIPGGTAPLFSTILMLGIPAKIAGCENIILCTPVDALGKIHPAILYTAELVGIDTIYTLGGAQAIAAMGYGTETIPQVYKIFGPGNQYVTKAKQLIQQEGVAIDMPAGPSEVLVIADNTCSAKFVAADLLSQAEHGPDSQVVLLSDNEQVINDCLEQVNEQIKFLGRKDIAQLALNNSKAILLKSLDACLEFSNAYAPEHLIIASENANSYIPNISNAGSVFLGNFSCESAGDYASGTNHTLPTNGYAKSYSGVSLDSFVKKITFQEISKIGIKNLGPAIECMAEAEGLTAHKNAVSIRLKQLKDERN